MPAQFTLPPDNRSVGSGNPPADMNAVVDALTAQGAVYNVLNAAYAGGGDPAGTSDSQPAFQAAVNAVAASGTGTGIVAIPPGNWRLNSAVTVSTAGIYLIGAGTWATTLLYYGSGDCIRLYSPLGYGNGSLPSGGGVKGLIIDGTHASAGACGLHAGDIYQLQWDVGARFFQGSGSKGIWFDNQYFWAEDMYGHLFVEQNTTNLIFDNSANLSGSATGSFARPDLTVVLDAKGVGDGLVLKNAAQYYGGKLMLAGNMDYSSSATKHWAVTVAAPAGFSYTATNASPCVFTAAGHYYGNGTNVFLTGGTAPTGFTNGTSYFVVSTNIGAGTFQLSATSGGAAINSTSTGSGTVNVFQPTTLQSCAVNINVECNASNANPQPGTINFTSSSAATGNNNISRCTGVIDFSASSTGFATAANSNGNFLFDGPVYGDSLLWRSLALGATAFFNGALTSSSSIQTRGVTRTVVNTTTALTGMILQSGNPSESGLIVAENNGTGTVTFAVAATSHVKNGAGCVIPPNTSMMFEWRPDQGTWYPLGSQPPADPLALEPSGATGATIPRTQCNNYTSVLTSGQSYVSAIPLPGGLAISNLNVLIGSTGFSGVTHGWLALLDGSRVVQAVTADQTSSFGSANNPLSLAASGSYVTTAPGLYYFAVCAVASTMGTIPIGNQPLAGPNSTPPILAGTSGSSLTTPPALGSTMAAITASGTWRFYGYTS
ncbi:MAG TPA: hypothetical protein VGL33_21015 [Streptosporangiaceae bacterium]|jgi:hypothetical protein